MDKQNRIQWPMVNVDTQQNKSKVDVHVPIFFDMVNNNDKADGSQKLDLTVLQGLVTVMKDKARGENGSLTGPVKVTVFGIPVYTSKGSPVDPTLVASTVAAQRNLTNSIAQANSNLAGRTGELVARITENARRTNENLLSSLVDIFERFGVRQTDRAPLASSSGELANVAGG